METSTSTFCRLPTESKHAWHPAKTDQRSTATLFKWRTLRLGSSTPQRPTTSVRTAILLAELAQLKTRSALQETNLDASHAASVSHSSWKSKRAAWPTAPLDTTISLSKCTLSLQLVAFVKNHVLPAENVTLLKTKTAKTMVLEQTRLPISVWAVIRQLSSPRTMRILTVLSASSLKNDQFSSQSSRLLLLSKRLRSLPFSKMFLWSSSCRDRLTTMVLLRQMTFWSSQIKRF